MKTDLVLGLTLLYMTSAENYDPSGFVKRLRSYKSTCREIGWEPTCQRKTWNSNNDKLYLINFFWLFNIYQV